MPEKALEIAGETLIARADRTLFWPSASTLFVADIHLGKAEAFRASGVAAPIGTAWAALNRLSASLGATKAARLVILGDLWHAKEGCSTEVLQALSHWRLVFPNLEIVLIEGNHDRKVGLLPLRMNVSVEAEPSLEGPFAFAHSPIECTGRYCLSGHIHPSVTLHGPASQSLRLPCFWFSSDIGVLPAFGEFTGTYDISPSAGDSVYVIAEDRLHLADMGHSVERDIQAIED